MHTSVRHPFVVWWVMKHHTLKAGVGGRNAALFRVRHPYPRVCRMLWWLPSWLPQALRAERPYQPAVGTLTPGDFTLMLLREVLEVRNKVWRSEPPKAQLAVTSGVRRMPR